MGNSFGCSEGGRQSHGWATWPAFQRNPVSILSIVSIRSRLRSREKLNKGDTATTAAAVAVYAPWAKVGCEPGPRPDLPITLLGESPEALLWSLSTLARKSNR